MSKNVAGPTCYDIKQFQFLKHGTLPMIVTFLVQLVEMSETVREKMVSVHHCKGLEITWRYYFCDVNK